MEHQIHSAMDALRAGDFDAAQRFARDALGLADAAVNRLMQAKALNVLAEVDRQLSRYRRALEGSQRAAHLFRLADDVGGEIMALTTVAHCACNLGRNEDAVEAALLCVRLAEQKPLGPVTAAAYNYLGVTYLWSRDWERARQTFDSAAQMASQCEPPVSAAQPRLNQCICDMLRLSEQVNFAGACVDVAALQELSLRFQNILNPAPNSPKDQIQLPTIGHIAMAQFGLANVLAWQGEHHRAQELIAQSQPILDGMRLRNWLHAIKAWSQTELAWNQRDFAAAERYASDMVQIASEVEHEQLACLGRLKRARIAEDQSKLAQSIEELHLLRNREQFIRAEALASRERVVQWQMDARGTQTSLNNLQVASRELERLSLEDNLTGIANRRSFELKLDSLLSDFARSGETFSVALIDVDKFKIINDSYSHLVGDKVLKAIADILRSNMRENDVAARLGGDEFVVALGQAESVAQKVFERIRANVRDYDWASVAPGLSVGVSIGLTQADAGDTLEALLHRADMAMYAVKKSSKRTSA